MSTTTDRTNQPKRGLVLAISVAIQVALLVVVGFFAKSRLSINPTEVKERSAEVQKRERQRLEEERERRETTEIREDDAEKLREKARQKEENRIADKVREMRELEKRVREERDASLQDLANRSADDLNQAILRDLILLARRADEAAFHLSAQSPLPLAKATKPACEALVKSTEAGAGGDWSALADDLRAEATAIRNPLVKRHSEVAADTERTDGPSGDYGNFLPHSRSTTDRLDEYLLALDELVFTDEQLAALNDLGDVEFPEKPFPQDQTDTGEMSLDQLLEEAAALEDSIAEDFTELRAAEMAQLEGESFQEAMSKVSDAFSPPSSENQTAQSSDSQNEDSQNSPSNSASPSKQSANSSEAGSPSEGGNPSTVGDLQDYRAAQAAKGQQARGHWARAMNMAQQAGAMGSQNSAGRPSDSFAKSGQNGRSSRGQGRSGRPGNGGEGGGDGGSKSSQNRSGTATGFQNASGLSAEQARASRVQIPDDMVRARALPGRRFSSDSQRQGWLFLDTWYVIGPWENGGQLNYDNVHPPEVGIDLDASYPDGKFLPESQTERHPLRWQFVQSDIMRITPPAERGRATYYAYTEVYFDEPTDMLVAIATDDAARMWVNGKLVWEDQGLSGWSFNEGFRRIRFTEGFNQFLVRIENGPALCEYSVLLCPTQ